MRLCSDSGDWSALLWPWDPGFLAASFLATSRARYSDGRRRDQSISTDRQWLSFQLNRRAEPLVLLDVGPQALAGKEAEAKPYLEEARGWIFEACRGLIAKDGKEAREET